MLGHDLRSPLAGLIGCLDLLQRSAGPRLTEDEAHLVELSLRSAHALNQMVAVVHDVSRLETGRLPIQARNLDLPDLARSAIESAGPLTGNCKCVADAEAPLPPVHCDPDLISRVICILLRNAAKYAPDNSTIRMSLTLEKDRVRVAIADEGPPIPVEFHNLVFEKFGQKNGPARRAPGLGLAFCRLAIQAHEGRIGIESGTGPGCVFWFSLPAAQTAK
jgi:K+-sensing histidine kinase KdpD